MTRRPRILVRGAGLAGIITAKLLRDRGAEVRVAAAPRVRGRIAAIPIETLQLAAELCGLDVAALTAGPLIARRRVDWSAQQETAVMPQVALICDVADFAATLADRLDEPTSGASNDDVDWTIEAAGRPGDQAARAGDRVGQFVRLATATDPATMVVAATDGGWLFAAPHPDGGSAVLLVSPSVAARAATAEEVVRRLAGAGLKAAAGDVAEIGPTAPIAPALAQPLHTGNMLRVGDAALALDPLRGDGSGFALRGALLAQAVLAAIERGEDRDRCLGHYVQRLGGVFAGHLRGCISHYRAARNAAIWRHDIAAMEALTPPMTDPVPFDFRVEGRDLMAT